MSAIRTRTQLKVDCLRAEMIKQRQNRAEGQKISDSTYSTP